MNLFGIHLICSARPHALPPTLRHSAATALVARALRATGRKAKPKEISYG